MQAYYQAQLEQFWDTNEDEILGTLTSFHVQALEHLQTRAWQNQISYLKQQLEQHWKGKIYFEFKIPRMGKRADCILFINSCVFVLEFKVGSSSFDRFAIDQAYDYALDLKNFHLGSHDLLIFPIVVATKANTPSTNQIQIAKDLVAKPFLIGELGLNSLIKDCLAAAHTSSHAGFTVAEVWEKSGYMPTPTIVEAAQALYKSHNVEDIARSDSDAKNLSETTDEIFKIIERSKILGRKSICFVTGVPGAGKTLAGLNIATSRSVKKEEHAVFLSGNGPLVEVLREALARDKVVSEKVKKKDAQREVSSFIQNIHHFRDEYFTNPQAPIEKVVIFDEAQRAWSKEQATKFMTGKWGSGYAPQSEPEFLVKVMDRHNDWCCVVCLIGGGQEINTGEAGIIEWLKALDGTLSSWDVYISDVLSDEHYTIDDVARLKLQSSSYQTSKHLHLATSMRSFRAEKLSAFISEIISGNDKAALKIYSTLADNYPIFLTRKLEAAREWLRRSGRGTERIGLVASAGALRLRPEGIFIKSEIDATNWFLNDKGDVRSSFFLEDVATQFDIQGLELDYVGVCWDADLRYEDAGWKMHAFRGSKWQNVSSPERKKYLLNAYRVLLTRARQGMVIFIPEGSENDPTRPPTYYDGVFNYLRDCGIQQI